jgi:hypothetical protein
VILRALDGFAVLVVLVSLTVVATASYRFRHASSKARDLVGTRPFSGRELSGSGEARNATFVLVLSPDCQFCTASMPVIRHIASVCAERRTRLRCQVLGSEPPTSIGEYLSTHDVQFERVMPSMPRTSPLARLTPRGILMDATGLVRRDWVGNFPRYEQEILRTLSQN